MKLRKSPDDGTVPLDDLLRRLSFRGFEIDKLSGDATLLSFQDRYQVHIFTDPVEEAVVWSIAEHFEIDVMKLYFDKVEGDLH